MNNNLEKTKVGEVGEIYIGGQGVARGYVNRTSMTKKKFMLIAFFVGFILLIPLVAMQFTDEVNWNISDFLIAGVLLFSLGVALDFVARKVNQSQNRIVIWGAIVICFLLIWAELAVGIFFH